MADVYCQAPCTRLDARLADHSWSRTDTMGVNRDEQSLKGGPSRGLPCCSQAHVLGPRGFLNPGRGEGTSKLKRKFWHFQRLGVGWAES